MPRIYPLAMPIDCPHCKSASGWLVSIPNVWPEMWQCDNCGHTFEITYEKYEWVATRKIGR